MADANATGASSMVPKIYQTTDTFKCDRCLTVFESNLGEFGFLNCDNCGRTCCDSCMEGFSRRCVDCPEVTLAGTVGLAKAGLGDSGTPRPPKYHNSLLTRRKWHHTKSTASGLRKSRRRSK